MLEKNKDYLEMRVSGTDCAFAQNEWAQVRVDGYVYTTYMNRPDPGELYIFISKEKFEMMQTEIEHYKRDVTRLQARADREAELAKQWEINYDLLLKKIGFDTVEELVNYLDSEAECNTLREAIASLEYSVKFARDERRDLSKKLDECEKDYISERDKAEALQTENEQLKKKLQVPDPFAEYKELLEKLHSKEDVEKFEWTLNHICGGKASANGWMVTAKLWRRNYETLSKLIGFSSTEEIQDYLTNEAECDTLQEAISKLKDQVKYTCDEWYSANSSNNSWKAAAECNSPKELIEKLSLLRDDISGRSTVIERYKRDIEKWQKATDCLRPEDIFKIEPETVDHADIVQLITDRNLYKTFYEQLDQEVKILNGALQEWKDSTKCEKPEAAATWITSYESACERGNRLAKMVEKLKEEVYSWKNVTGYSTPEDYMHARISGAFHTPFDYTAAWQKATKCDTPEQAKERIKALNERIDESEACYNHLLNLTGFESEGEIEDALDKCDHSTLRKALVDYEFDYEELLKLTGYKSNQDIRVALNYSEQFVYETMRELINSLKRQAKYTNLNWQNSTGFITPEKCGEHIKKLEDKLHRINGISEED